MFQGKLCVIVGVTGELGRTIAEKLAAKRCNIAIMDNNKAMGKRLAKTLRENYGVETFFFHGRTENEEDLEIFASAVMELYGKVNFLIHSFDGQVRVNCISATEEKPSEVNVVKTICGMCEKQILFWNGIDLCTDNYLWKMVAYPKNGWKMVPWEV